MKLKSIAAVAVAAALIGGGGAAAIESTSSGTTVSVITPAPVSVITPAPAPAPVVTPVPVVPKPKPAPVVVPVVPPAPKPKPKPAPVVSVLYEGKFKPGTVLSIKTGAASEFILVTTVNAAGTGTVVTQDGACSVVAPAPAPAQGTAASCTKVIDGHSFTFNYVMDGGDYAGPTNTVDYTAAGYTA